MAKEPTPRMRRVAKIFVENGGKSLSGAMREAGMSDAYAKTPAKLTNSENWRKALDEVLPDDLLNNALREDIEAKKGHRKAELELAYKLKGRLTTAPDTGSGGNTYNTYIQQNNLDPNAPEARTLVDNTLDMLMKQTEATDVEQG